MHFEILLNKINGAYLSYRFAIMWNDRLKTERTLISNRQPIIKQSKINKERAVSSKLDYAKL